MRRQKLPPDLAEEIAPKNILMIGPTGVGKTEIARRLARLAQSPFLKVEASKFTEVGYVGRDVESMVRDLVELARRDGARGAARRGAREGAAGGRGARARPAAAAAARRRRSTTSRRRAIREQAQRTREKLREQLRDGRLDHKHVEIDVREKSFPSFEIIAGSSVEEVDINVKDMLPGPVPGAHEEAQAARCPRRSRRCAQEEEQKLDRHGHRGARRGRARAAGRASSSSTRSTRSPAARAATAPTSAARACSATSCRSSKARRSTPSTGWCRPTTSCSSPPARSTSRSRRTDPGAAGPLSDPRRARGARPRGFRPHPDRAEERAGQAVHRRCSRPKASTLPFTPGAIERIADFATLVNERTENIGARRLHTVMEKLLDEVSFDAPELPDKERHDRRGLRRPHARRHRPQRRPVALRPVMASRRAARMAVALTRSAAPDVACGQKGPPLAPLHLVPAAANEVSTARRVGDRARLRFVLPIAQRERARAARARSRRDLRDDRRRRTRSSRRMRELMAEGAAGRRDRRASRARRRRGAPPDEKRPEPGYAGHVRRGTDDAEADAGRGADATATGAAPPARQPCGGPAAPAPAAAATPATTTPAPAATHRRRRPRHTRRRTAAPPPPAAGTRPPRNRSAHRHRAAGRSERGDSCRAVRLLRPRLRLLPPPRPSWPRRPSR